MHSWKNFFFFLLVFFAKLEQGTAQRIIQVRYNQDRKGNYDFICENHAFCHYIVEVRVTGLENLRSDQALPYRKEVAPGTTHLFNLIPENQSVAVKFNYSAAYLKGCLQPNPKTDITYLLPLAPGKEAQIYEMQNFGKAKAGDPEIRDWYVIRIKMNPGDTIYAARRGVVSELDVSSGANDSGANQIGGTNFIEIVHADCSFGRYGIIRKNGSLVKAGQNVEAGSPIGIVGGDRFGRGAEIRFSVSYNEEVFDAAGNEKQYQVFLPLWFWIKYKGRDKIKHGAEYVSEHPPAIIAQEKATKAPPKKTAPKSKKT
jgi:Peptidase family M23